MAAYTLMASGGVTRTSDGASIPEDMANTDWQAYLAWVVAGNTAAPAPSPTPPTSLTPLAFLNRFTPTEQAAVQAVAAGSPVIALGLTIGLATGAIDLTNPAIIGWMAGLVAAGALTSARSTAILTP